MKRIIWIPIFLNISFLTYFVIIYTKEHYSEGGIFLRKNVNEELKSLKQSMEMLEDLLDTAYYGMAIVDTEGKIVKWNYEKLMGIKESDVLDQYVQDIIENTRLHIVAKTGEKELFEIQTIQGRDMITSRVPIIKDGNIIGAAGTVLFKDVKELKSLVQKLEALEDTVHKYKGAIKRLHKTKFSFDNIITQNNRMIYLKEIAKMAAESNATILIQGESGTGKELFAHGVHKASFRKHGPFVTINCAAIPNELLESELFGYEPGAFTGAKKEGKIGKFELANGGTILLDEIGSMPMEMQAKLLRVLEGRELERVGGNARIEIDIRLIASTNENLEKAVEEGKFRQDLYYRLNVIQIEIPPLRDRIDDIPLLAEHILKQLADSIALPNKKLSNDTIHVLRNHHWPGNIRELRNVLERSFILCKENTIQVEHLPDYLSKKAVHNAFEEEDSLLLKDIIARVEKEAIKRAIEESKGNKSMAAKLLGIHRTALYKKIEIYDIDI